MAVAMGWGGAVTAAAAEEAMGWEGAVTAATAEEAAAWGVAVMAVRVEEVHVASRFERNGTAERAGCR